MLLNSAFGKTAFPCPTLSISLSTSLDLTLSMFAQWPFSSQQLKLRKTLNVQFIKNKNTQLLYTDAVRLSKFICKNMCFYAFVIVYKTGCN